MNTFTSSVQIRCPVLADSLWPHGPQHARLPCPSPTPRAYSDSCPLSWWCHPTISSSVTSFFCPQFFPAAGSFPVSWLFTSGDHKYWSFSFSISPSNAYSGLISFRIDWFGHHVHKAIFKMDNQQEPITENSAQCYTATLDGRGVGYMYMDSWVALLSTWNYHNRLYSSIKEKFF